MIKTLIMIICASFILVDSCSKNSESHISNQKTNTAVHAVYNFGPKMKELKAEAIPDRLIANERRIKEFEDHIGVSLPPDYRSLLSRHSGTWLSAKFRVNEPTPFGNEGTIETIYGFMKKNRRSDDLYNKGKRHGKFLFRCE